MIEPNMQDTVEVRVEWLLTLVEKAALIESQLDDMYAFRHQRGATELALLIGYISSAKTILETRERLKEEGN